MSDFGWAEGIAVIAIGVSILSVVYAAGSASAADRSADAARRSANEAGRANTISIHQHRKEILSSLVDLHLEICKGPEDLDPAMVNVLCDRKLAFPELYLSKETSDKIENFKGICTALLYSAKEYLDLRDDLVGIDSDDESVYALAPSHPVSMARSCYVALYENEGLDSFVEAQDAVFEETKLT